MDGAEFLVIKVETPYGVGIEGRPFAAVERDQRRRRPSMGKSIEDAFEEIDSGQFFDENLDGAAAGETDRQAFSSLTPNFSKAGRPVAITSAAVSSTSPSTQPPDTEPMKWPESSTAIRAPAARGDDPQLDVTVAKATPRPALAQAIPSPTILP